MPVTTYIAEQLRKRIDACAVLVCLIGYGTHSRRWVNWEMVEALKKAVTEQPDVYDRNAILKNTIDPVKTAARAVIRGMQNSGN